MREKDLLQPIHYAAYAVDPECMDGHKPLTIPECMDGFHVFCEKLYPGDSDRQTNAVLGLSAFLHGDGAYGRETAKAAARRMPGYRWAQMYSTTHPDFQRAQAILLSLFTSHGF